MIKDIIPQIKEFLARENYNLYRVTVADNDEIITIEQNPAPVCSNTYSVAKFYTMVAAGLLYDKKLLTPEDKILDILSDEIKDYKDEIDPRWQNSTLAMAMNHALGLPGGFLDIDVLKMADFDDDFLRYTLTYPLDYTPGTDSKYSDGAFYLVARCCEKLCGMPLDTFLWKELFRALEYREFAWSKCPDGHVIGGSGAYANSEDTAKLGLIFMNGGLYKGRRYLSEQWIKTATERSFALDWDDAHRYYAKGGMFGQKIAVDTVHGRSIAVQGFGADSGKIVDFICSLE